MASIKLNVADLSAPVQQGARLPISGLGLTPVPLEVGASAGKGLMQAGQVLNDLARVEQATAIETQGNKARAQALQALAEAESESRGDVDIFRERTRGAFAEIAESVTDPVARRRFLSSIEPEAAGVEFRIRREGRAMRAAEAVGALEEVVGRAANRAAAATTDAERQAATDLGRQAIEGAVQAGFLSGAAARTRAQRFQAEVSEGVARRLLTEDPTRAATLLRDPEALPGLSPVQRYRLLDATIRRGRVAGGGMRAGGGPAPEDVPDLSPQVRSDLERDAERVATAEDQREMQVAAFQERQGFASWQDRTRTAAEQFFVGMSNLGGDAQDVPMRSVADLLPAQVAQAAQVVADTGGAGADEPEALGRLLVDAGGADPEDFTRAAADEVSAGRITSGSFARLAQVNRDLTAQTPAATAWRRTREDAATLVEPPDMADLGVPGMADARAAALLEMDEWRAANPRAVPAEAGAAAREIAQRHRQAMVDRAVAALPALPGLGRGPYAPEALDEAEADTLGALDAGEIDMAEAARRLRVAEGWRWAGEDIAPERGP